MEQNPAITISRSLGCGGTEIGFLVARQLGWHFCDRRILRLSAGTLGCSAADLARREEHHSGYLEQLLAVLAIGPPEGVFNPKLERPIYSRDLYALEKRVMLKMTEHAPSVIVGRGGFVALRDRPDTLHVSIQADAAFRIQSLLDRGKAPDRITARKMVEASDRDRAAFIRDIAGVDWQDPRQFDLVLERSLESSQACAERIVEEAKRRLAPCGGA